MSEVTARAPLSVPPSVPPSKGRPPEGANAAQPAAEPVAPPAPAPLPPLVDDVSTPLRQAIDTLVKRKFHLDRDAAEHGAAALLPEWLEDQRVAMAPQTFFLKLFPFAHLWSAVGNPMHASVPVAWALGGSPRWRASTLSDTEAQERLAKLGSPDSVKGTAALRAEYAWLPQLGLVVPQVGKSRVDFFREMGRTHLPARVTPYSYPMADRLALYRVAVAGDWLWWAVLDGRWVERVAEPSWSLPVLSAYGVETRKPWPPSWPTVADVSVAFDHQETAGAAQAAAAAPTVTPGADVAAGAPANGAAQPAGAAPAATPPRGNRPMVDLHALVCRNEWAQQPLDVTLLELSPVRLNTLYPLAAGVISVISAISLVMVPDDRVALQVVAALVTGLGMGFLAAAIVPSLRVRRRLFDAPAPDA